MKTWLTALALLAPEAAWAMCGGMFPERPPVQPKRPVVAEAASARVVNKSSKVILTRDGENTTITMANDYKGEASNFALVVPVPTAITKSDVTVLEPNFFSRLEDVTAPRLTEVFDPRPCPDLQVANAKSVRAPSVESTGRGPAGGGPHASDYGVKVEAHFVVGEYEIAILKGTQSNKLVQWLNLFHYNIPPEAEPMFNSYLGQGMRFFVARVSLKDKSAGGFSYLRPLQVHYQTPKFMLPIRLGMLNADGPQELMVYALSRLGRVEPVNYRNAVLPAGGELPQYVKADFNGFYSAFFAEQTRKVGMAAVFVEWAGQAPVQAGPPIPEVELQPTLAAPSVLSAQFVTAGELEKMGATWAGHGEPVQLTRLHFKYDREHFPEDLVLQETGDRGPKRVAFSIRHPWLGDPDECDQARAYLATLPARFETEATTLASLTGWDVNEIRKKQPALPPPTKPSPQPAPAPKKDKSLWDRLFGD